MIVVLHKSADEACSCFEGVDSFLPYVDASSQPSSFELYIEDCLKGLSKAFSLGWFNPSTFNLREYEHLSSVDSGGLSWLVPSKLLAFICPASERSSKYPALTPENYASLFKSLGVSDVVRLNNKTYDADRFSRAGLQHSELYFLDGSVPSAQIVDRFLQIVDNAAGAVAVHCKAGLGRTATLIGCYVIKHFDFTGLEFIGWARICRPGSVLGPQQQFLCDQYSEKHGIEKKSVENSEDKYKARFGDYGQGGKLVSKSASGAVIGGNKKSGNNTMTAVAKIMSVKSLGSKKKEK
jgi:cell division cycle 14